MVPNMRGVCALVSLWYVVFKSSLMIVFVGQCMLSCYHDQHLDITSRCVRDVEESSPPMKTSRGYKL